MTLMSSDCQIANMTLIDTHCHFDDASFDPDRDAAYQRAQDAGVKAQIIPAVSADYWPRLRDVCEQYAGLFPAYGLHPLFLAQHREAHLTQLETYLQEEKPLAVGECGLDFYVEGLDKTRQHEIFHAHIELARQFDLPLIIHARRAVEQVILAVRDYPGIRGVVHSFAGSEEQARRLIDMGFYVSFGGPVSYERAKRLRRLVQNLPLDALLLETDAPDQPLSHRRGERNEAAYLPEVLAVFAQLRQQATDAIAAVTTRNAVNLFGARLLSTRAKVT